MADRSVRVFLRAEVTDFKRQMAEAGKATEATAAQFDKSGQQIQTTAGRMARSAEVNRDAWTTTGTVLTAAGAAITALGAAVAKTGIEYNTLQQTSRAAMATLLGGSEAANAQMDKLDDFARNSPFAKQVFITAQQQMLGFGVAAEDVLPALDSIQNAVAAMGGSNDQIAALAEILARIQSEGRLSGDALQRMGYYGIDAAAIIGNRMGVTAAEIRDMARKPGGIPVDQIWDPLVDGMNDKFGGAAENVKNTYEGAMDRVRAAWRDTAAELMTPLVDPNGGGFLIDLANQAADAMRAFQALPAPIRDTVAATTGLAGIAMLAGGGFLLLVPRIQDTTRAMDTLTGRMGTAATAAGKFAKGGALVTGVAAGMFIVTQATTKMIDALTVDQAELGANEIEQAVRRVVEAGGDLSALDGLFSNFGTVLGVNRVETEGVIDVLNKLSDPSGMDRFREAVGGSAGYMALMRERAEGLDTALASMAASGATEYVDGFQRSLRDAGFTAEEINELLPATRDALVGVEEAQRTAADSGGRLAEIQERQAAAQDKLTDAREAYREEVQRWRSVMTDAFTGFADSQGAFDAAMQGNIEAAQRRAAEVNEANAEWARGQEDPVKRATKTWEDYYDGVTVSARAYIDELQAQIDAQQTWADNVNAVSDRLADTFSGDALANARQELDALAGAGPASAGVVATLAGATDKELAEIVRLWGIGGEDSAREFVDAFQSSADPFIEPRLDMTLAQMTLDQWARQEVMLEVSMTPANPFAGTTATGSGRFTPPLFSDVNNTRRGALAGMVAGTRGYANGGSITGAGTGTSDSIPIWASDGEYMHRAAAVSFWGMRAMESVNNNDVAGLWRELGAKGFRDGGSISAPAPAQVVTVPVEYRYEEHAPQHFNFHGQSAFNDGMDFAEKRRLNDRGGR